MKGSHGAVGASGGGGTSSGFNSPASSNSGTSLHNHSYNTSSHSTDLWQTAIQSSILGTGSYRI